MRECLVLPHGLTVLLAWAAGAAHAQPCAPYWDPTIGVPGMDGLVDALCVFDNATGQPLYAGGFFTSAGGLPANKIAKRDGQTWSALGDGMLGFYPNSLVRVEALDVFDDGTGPALYAGGAFEFAGGVRTTGIARWDGKSWSGLDGGLGWVNALCVFDDGAGPALYAGGYIRESYGASNRPLSGIAKWDGRIWSPLGLGIGGRGYASGPGVVALAVFDDGTGPALYAGGEFTLAGGAPANNIAKWDGRGWWPLGQGLTGYVAYVNALAIYDDGTGPALYVGGGFTYAGGQPANSIARWNGVTWSPVAQGTVGVVDALAVFADGTSRDSWLYADGWWQTGEPGGPHRVARWDGVAWRALTDGPDWAVFAMEPQQVPSATRAAVLTMGGEFTRVGEAVANRLAAWQGCVFADLDGDEDVDLGDFVIFQQCYAGSGNPPAPTCPPGVDADFDDDGDVDLADFLIFQQNFTGSG